MDSTDYIEPNDDELLALALEAEELDSSNKESTSAATTSDTPKRPRLDSHTTQSLVDPEWEVIDPTPDIRVLHAAFDDRFFQGRLRCVEVKWSKRMTLCAGVCSYEGCGGLCSIRLSEPLLRLRPRKDLVETLLHEEIHAYLFVIGGDRDHDAHGPRFHEHMHRINHEAGTHVGVYHSFHDEVDHYRVHWWRCTGPCRERVPYFGYVKRSMNRAPSARDPWWPEHAATCGGTYVKVQGPEMTGAGTCTGASSASAPAGNASSGRRLSGGKSATSTSTTQFPGRGQVLGDSSASNLLDRFVERTPRRSSSSYGSQTQPESSQSSISSVPDCSLLATAAAARAGNTHVLWELPLHQKEKQSVLEVPSDSEDEAQCAARPFSADEDDEALRRAIALSLVEQ